MVGGVHLFLLATNQRLSRQVNDSSSCKGGLGRPTFTRGIVSKRQSSAAARKTSLGGETAIGQVSPDILSSEGANFPET